MKHWHVEIRNPSLPVLRLEGFYVWRNTAIRVSEALRIEVGRDDQAVPIACEKSECSPTFYRK